MSDIETKQAPYRVLARKYRPQNFDALVGQDALVRTLKNAIDSGRIAQAYMLTGIRGTGKTTTARIIAKALNYTGPDGKSGPTTGPTDDCAECQAIAADRHPDVIEMDAASNTGVDDIREIIDGVRYAPTSARYKVYIIDEVHMLSKQAFNALLKTLEEPPAHVIFIFATTEIRKVPITVLSRCQKFQLRRVDQSVLAEYYGRICAWEKAEAEVEALNLIARAADGSVRDGLSLLDQAISLGDGKVTTDQVKDMLGLADQAIIFDLFEAMAKGSPKETMDVLATLHRAGADPLVVTQDLMDVTHFMTKVNANPTMAESDNLTDTETARGLALATSMSAPALHKIWQILMKGLMEVQQAPNPAQALEMIALRIVYASDMPDPKDLVRMLDHGKIPNLGLSESAAKGAAFSNAPPSSGNTTVQSASPQKTMYSAPSGGGGGQVLAFKRDPEVEEAQHETQQPATETVSVPTPAQSGEPAMPQNFADVVALISARGAKILAAQMHQSIHPVKFETGRIEIRIGGNLPGSVAGDIASKLTEYTGTRWVVSISDKPGEPTLAERDAAIEAAKIEKIRNAPEIANVFKIFPDAKITAIRTIEDDTDNKPE